MGSERTHGPSLSDDRPIGIFDSGVGGLTVVRAITDTLPSESIVYFGDTARFPYGPRPLEEVRRFAVEIAQHLMERDVKMIVIACNTATAAALNDVAEAVSVPVVGVIEPPVRASIRATRNGKVGLIGTEGTVRSGAYQQAFDRLRPGPSIELIAQACPRFVEFVERGDTTSPELLAAAESYLALLRVASVDTLILGCTHYPLLRSVLRHVIGPEVVLVSSADETAADVYETLIAQELLRTSGGRGQRVFESSGDTGQFVSLVTLFMTPNFFDQQARVPLETEATSRWN
jgi:glutamate racemase